MTKKLRVDQLLVQRGMVESRAKAQRLVMAGEIRVNGQMVMKPSRQVDSNAIIKIIEKQKYVSRGGDKLDAAVSAFSADIDDKICADVGASTGGFTDCLLQHGAKKVYAIDVGHGILHWKLRKDTRVVVMEKTNARYLKQLDQKIELITIDASFISLKVLLPVVKGWFVPNGGEVIALIKPQFEAGRKDAAKGKGVIRDENVHRKILYEVLSYAENEGYQIKGIMRSPVIGPKGNVEFLTWLYYPACEKENWQEKVDMLFGQETKKEKW